MDASTPHSMDHRFQDRPPASDEQLTELAGRIIAEFARWIDAITATDPNYRPELQIVSDHPIRSGSGATMTAIRWADGPAGWPEMVVGGGQPAQPQLEVDPIEFEDLRLRLTPLLPTVLGVADTAAFARELPEIEIDPANRAGFGPGVHISAMRNLATHPRAEVRVEVARGSYTPAEVLRRLAADPQGSVRRAAAVNPETPAGALFDLSGDLDSAVRRRVAGRRDTPAVAFMLLADDPDATVRRAAAANPSVPERVLLRLMRDEAESVSGQAARNPSLPRPIVGELVGDPGEVMRPRRPRTRTRQPGRCRDCAATTALGCAPRRPATATLPRDTWSRRHRTRTRWSAPPSLATTGPPRWSLGI